MRPKLLLVAAAAFKTASRSASASSASEATTSKFRFSSGFDTALAAKFSSSFLVHEDFVTAEEEAALMSEVEPHLGRLVYEKDHWDEVRNCFGFKFTARFGFILQKNDLNSLLSSSSLNSSALFRLSVILMLCLCSC